MHGLNSNNTAGRGGGGEGYLPLTAAASFAGLSVKSLRRAIAAGRLRGFRPTGGSRGMILLARRDLVAWIEGAVIEDTIGRLTTR